MPTSINVNGAAGSSPALNTAAQVTRQLTMKEKADKEKKEEKDKLEKQKRERK